MAIKVIDEKLLPCPFCGGKAELRAAEMAPDTFYVICTKCEIRTLLYLTREAAAKRWNRRKGAWA